MLDTENIGHPYLVLPEIVINYYVNVTYDVISYVFVAHCNLYNVFRG
jgi:hypothetical protein